MNLDFENLKSYTTEELEDAQKLLSQELRRRNQEKQEMETLERLAAKYGLRVTKELEPISKPPQTRIHKGENRGLEIGS